MIEVMRAPAAEAGGRPAAHDRQGMTMARMKQLAPRGRTLQLRGAARPGQRMRDRISTWRRWYKTAEWQRLRWSVLSDALFTCARCGRIGTGPDLVADHVQPHRGDRALFFDRGNLQCLCKACHDGAKQREERATPGR